MNHRIVLVIFTCFSFIPCIGDIQAQTADIGRWSIGLEPGLAGQIRYESNVDLTSDNTPELEITSGPTYTTLLQIEFNFNQTFQLSSGVGYERIWMKVRDEAAVFSCDIDENDQIQIRNSWYKSDYKAHYVTIPLIFNYAFKDTRFFVRGGAQMGYRFHEDHVEVPYKCGIPTTQLEGPTPGDTPEYQGLAMGGAGVVHNTYAPVQLLVGVDLRQYFLPVFHYEDKSKYPLDIRFYVGIRLQ